MRENKNGIQCRVIKDKNFTVMSNVHLQMKELSLKAKGLMSLCLSLPESWDYSIAGLVTLSSDGRDSVTSALNELKKYGLLDVEKNRGQKGFFSTTYIFYESPKLNPNFKKPENRELDGNGFSDTDNPMRVNRCGSSDADNPQQINTNNKELKEITKTNQLHLVKTDEAVFTVENLFEKYKKICNHFPQPQKIDATRRSKAKKRLKEHPEENFWEEVFRKAERSKFLRESSFFSFDWILKNSTNVNKLFEGNYNKVEIKSETPNESGGKYSKCYG